MSAHLSQRRQLAVLGIAWLITLAGEPGASATGVVASATGVVASATGVVASATGVVASATGVVASATGVVASATEAGPQKGGTLPVFSEEREAAALHFVKKQLPELAPVLDKLKSSDAKKYRTEICEIFQVSEWLTDMRDEDEKRYAVELEVWKTETKSNILVAKLAGLSEEERETHKAELQAVAAKLVDLDMQIMRLRIEQLEQELGAARDEMTKADGQREHMVKERFERLLDEAKKRGTK